MIIEYIINFPIIGDIIIYVCVADGPMGVDE